MLVFQNEKSVESVCTSMDPRKNKMTEEQERYAMRNLHLVLVTQRDIRMIIYKSTRGAAPATSGRW
jgi:hypothetical protein